METVFEGRSLDSFTVVELKKELKKRRQSTIGKKKELVDRLSMAIVQPSIEQDESEQHENVAHRPITPSRPHDIFEENPTRRSSRVERYSAKKEGLTGEDSYMSEDEDNVEQPKPGISARRPSAVRRSVYKKLGLHDSFITPDRDSKLENSLSMRTRSRSRDEREKTHSISPTRSKLRESVFIKRRSISTNNTPARKAPKTPNGATSVPRAGRVADLVHKHQKEMRETQSNDSTNNTPAETTNTPSVANSAPRTGRVVDRFAAQHKKLLEFQPTLEEARDNLEKRHLEHTQNLPSVVKRLATPKYQATASRLPVKVEPNSTSGFKFDSNVNVQNFKFGQSAPEDFGNIPKMKPSSVSKGVVKPDSGIKKDAKEIAKKQKVVLRALTRPVESTFIQYISTPKGQTPIKTPSRSGYKPHRGKLPAFNDTSKLTDAQLLMARETGQLSQQKYGSKQIENNKKKREEQLNVRRKL